MMSARASRRWLRRALVAVLVLVLLAVVGVVAWSRIGVMSAEPAPWRGVVEDPRLSLAETDTSLLLQPAESGPARTGLVFYPGAKVEPEAYAARLAGLVIAQGMTVVIVKPTLNLALLDRRDFDVFTGSAPEVRTWLVGGHSLGGVRACQLASEADALVLFAAYCADDLSTSQLPVLSIAGSEDGLSTPADIAANRDRLPGTATMVEIDGASHASFGDYGAQSGDGTATLTDPEMNAAVSAAVAELLSARS